MVGIQSCQGVYWLGTNPTFSSLLTRSWCEILVDKVGIQSETAFYWLGEVVDRGWDGLGTAEIPWYDTYQPLSTSIN